MPLVDLIAWIVLIVFVATLVVSWPFVGGRELGDAVLLADRAIWVCVDYPPPAGDGHRAADTESGALM